MKIIIGLGNPEKLYDGTRHNSGYAVLDAYAAQHNLSFRVSKKFGADIAEGEQDGQKFVLVKPTTYYNNSGEAARKISDFYKTPPEDILIIHDELMLPFGTIRTRQGGSDAGNNGIKSINLAVSPETARVRVGIENELRARMDDADFVLSRFSADEQKVLPDIYRKIVAIIDDFLTDNFLHTTHK